MNRAFLHAREGAFLFISALKRYFRVVFAVI